MRDPRGDLGRLEGKAAHEQLSDNIKLFKFLLRMIVMPFWLPMWYVRRRRHRQEMIEFSQSVAARGVDHREVALRWVLAHPDDFILGEYDPKRRKVERTFRKLMIGRR